MGRTIARRWLIAGRVQGVGFRYFAEAKARQLGLIGWVRNLDDGRVEVYAAGHEAQINDFAASLHMGPRMAEVRSVDEKEDSVETHSGFSVR